MLIPTALNGIYREVLSRCRRMVTAIKRGASLDQAIGTAGVSDSESLPGLLVLHGPSPLIGGDPNTHLYLPLSVINKAILQNRLQQEVEYAIFTACCQHPWGTLALISPTNLMWIQPVDRHRSFLEACLQHWELFAAIGSRFSLGSRHGQKLCAIPTNINFVLARQGVNPLELNHPQSYTAVKRLMKTVIGK